MHHVITLKRSVATLAAAAGLLAAAAGPAGAQAASAAPCTVTCLDQDLTTLRWSTGGDDRSATLSLKLDSNEVAQWHAPQRTSLGRENSIEM
jgi:hypothetical protein